MINLLPDNKKREIQAARMNVVLLRYNLLTVSALGFLVLLCLAFYVILHSSQTNAMTTSIDNNQKAASYNDVRKAADEYRSDLKIASAILDRGTSYTPLIFAMSKLMPDGVVMNTIDLNAQSFLQQVSFTASARNYALATQLKNNFQTSDLFCNVHFENLTDSNATGSGKTDDKYPIAITISVKFKKADQKQC